MNSEPEHPPAVTLAYFHRFVEIHGGRDAFQDLTTEDVCDRFILPFTESTKLSLVDHVSQEPDGQQFVQPTQWFVSHAWSYHFLDVLDALDNFVDENNLDQRVAFWFCAFNNNQHDIKGQIRSFEFWLGGVQAALTSSRLIVMVVSPWTNPVTLTRTWCVYEVYMSIVLNARFEIAMGKTQKMEFLQDMKSGLDQKEIFLKTLATINTQESTTTIASDRDHIFKLISDQVGFAKLDQMVLKVMQDWMVRTVKHQAEAAIDPEEKCQWHLSLGTVYNMTDNLVEAEIAFKTAADIHQESLPRSLWLGWSARHWEAYVKSRLLKPKETWEPLFKESLPMLKELLGPEHKSTLRAIRDEGESYCHFGDYATGMPLLEECFATQERVLGRDHVETLPTLLCAGMYKSRQGQLVEATQWLERAYKLHREIYGESNGETNICRGTLAVCYCRQGKYAQAEPLLLTSYDHHWRTLGPDHSNTCAALFNLSAILRFTGKYDTAEANLRFCKASYERMGETSWVMHCDRSLALVLFAQGRLDEAKEWFENVTQAYTAAVGPKHPFTQGALFDRYFLQLELPGGFTLPETMEAIENALKASDIFHENWNGMSCHGCYTTVQGTMCTCSKCPRFAIRYCTKCMKTFQPPCGHAISSWTRVKPPARFIQEERLKLLAKQGNWDDFKQNAKEYDEYCEKFNVLERIDLENLKSNQSPKRSHAMLVGLTAGALVLAIAIRWGRRA
ncbi:hypothetical protein AeMF1_012725 [Aphanomyces euteiches]|nr:hypothetical protein AeMF1_012725 [Aphanomyces euteiches]